jgi:hypothetical protein
MARNEVSPSNVGDAAEGAGAVDDGADAEQRRSGEPRHGDSIMLHGLGRQHPGPAQRCADHHDHRDADKEGDESPCSAFVQHLPNGQHGAQPALLNGEADDGGKGKGQRNHRFCE